MLKAIDKFLNNAPKWALFWCTVIFILLMTLSNHYTNSELAFSTLYIVPIFVVAWYVGPFSAIIISLASALSWDLNDIYAGKVFSHYVIPYLNTLIRFNIFIIISLFLMEIRRQLNQVAYLADTDGLTGLANIRCFNEDLKFETKRNKRYKRPFTLVYIDCDNFKEVNDTHGHDAGDRLLRDVANTLRTNLRNSDIVARIGGDEFAILLPETDYDGANAILHKFHKKLLLTMKLNRWPVTFSIGAVTFQNALSDIKDMVKAADDLMYDVKTNGKNDIIHELWSERQQ